MLQNRSNRVVILSPLYLARKKSAGPALVSRVSLASPGPALLRSAKPLRYNDISFIPTARRALFGEILQKFVKKSPIAVMVQGLWNGY
jgi:hypothetical protein